MDIQMQPIEGSSHIEAAGYDAGSQTLRVQFKGGKSYDYAGVPPEKVREFQGSSSKGQFLRTFIKGIHTHAKV